MPKGVTKTRLFHRTRATCLAYHMYYLTIFHGQALIGLAAVRDCCQPPDLVRQD